MTNAQSIRNNAPRAYYLLRSVVWILSFILLAEVPAQAVTLTAEEQKIASSLVGNSGQRRDKSQMRLDDRLVQVARERAMDMAKRRYFDHTNPDGYAANYLVRQTGYQLPSSYSTSARANNIESIGAGYTSGSEAWSAWMGSSGHKAHLLATESFYRDQTSYGVGHYYDSSSPYRHYWVVLTAPPSPVALLSIATPTPGARVTVPSMSVSGSVSGSAVFSSLQYRLETPSGAGTWNQLPLPSGGGVGRWSANVGGLQPGVNTVRVRTLNSSGGVARETSRSVRMVVLKPLTVSVDGPGSVTPGFLGVTQREVGVAYTIAAIPQAGNILSHWDGLPAGTDPYRGTQTITMKENLSLTAHFIADPYLALAAGYAGVFTDTGPAHETTGALMARIIPGGAFTGAVFFSGQRFALRGRFNSQGDALVNVPRPGRTPLILALHIDTTGADQRITGSITNGTVNLSIAAGRSPATTTACQYNVHLSPAADAATPQGHGYAMVFVGPTGLVRVSGMLADGTPFAAASYLTNSGIPIYAPLFARTGSLAGTIAVNGSAAQGTVAWHKPARPGTRFPNAFHVQNSTVGSRFVRPATAADAALPIGNATLQIDSPELAEILSLSFTINAGTRVTYPALLPAGWRVGINALNGRFAGSYVHPGGGVRRFSGLVDQAASAGYGFSLGPTQSAAVGIQR
jgi:uncharacterized protein YkwD